MCPDLLVKIKELTSPTCVIKAYVEFSAESGISWCSWVCIREPNHSAAVSRSCFSIQVGINCIHLLLGCESKSVL